MLGPGVSPVKRQVFFLWLVADQYAQAKAAEGPISPRATERTLICFMVQVAIGPLRVLK